MLVLTEVSCPNCLSPIDIHNHSGNTINCGACRTNFIVEGHLCPKCHSYHKHEVDTCGQCGTSLQRICGKCRLPNWAGDEFCKACGVAMDLFEVTNVSFHEMSNKHKAERMAQVREMRLQEEARSQQRMMEMRRMEEKRVAQVASLKKDQQKRDRVGLLLIGLIGISSLALMIFFSL